VIKFKGGFMRRSAAVVLLTTCLWVVAGVAGYAQEVHKIVADVPNAFTVAGNQLAAGRYEFEIPDSVHRTVVVRSLDGKHTATGLIVTGIAANPAAPEQPRLVFDTVGEQYILAEVWMPGHDGFLITGFRNDSQHKHSTIKITKAKS
jgi:hypothetical protein